ncbi:MAG: MOSC domain-containing protein [Methylococcales bacterium]|nr:MOSC domain-containing protein [Methylococcales bacterium]
MTSPVLGAITVYPVKSLAGINVSCWPVTKTGLQYDRKWMLVDGDGQFLSQRQLPKMALIKTALTDTHLVLAAPAMPDLLVPLVPPAASDLISCTIWHDQCGALGVSIEADQWLGQFLQHDCRLVYQADDNNRKVDPLYSVDADRTAFSDGFPFLLIADNSLALLNQQMQLNLSMARFRPNLVVSGCPAYAEDSWREINIGAIGFRLPKPCSRCAIPTLDPETALGGKEPLATLNRTRKWQNSVYFGQNALHNQTGVLSVGDVVEVTVIGENQPPI